MRFDTIELTFRTFESAQAAVLPVQDRAMSAALADSIRHSAGATPWERSTGTVLSPSAAKLLTAHAQCSTTANGLLSAAKKALKFL